MDGGNAHVKGIMGQGQYGFPPSQSQQLPQGPQAGPAQAPAQAPAQKKSPLDQVPQDPSFAGLRKMIQAAMDQCAEHGMSEEDMTSYCNGIAQKAGYSLGPDGMFAKPQAPAAPAVPSAKPGAPVPPPAQEHTRPYALDTEDLNGVQIWSTGTYNRDTYTEADLSDMERNFNELGAKMKPYVKLGHDDGQALLQSDGYPTAGWITNVKKQGAALYADFKNVPKKIAELIRAKSYGRFSPEIYWNLKVDGKIYRRVLKAVALLGADVPANPTLQDFINLYAQPFETDADLRAYHNEDTTMDQKEIDKLKSELEESKKLYSQAQVELKKIESEKFASEVDAAWKSRAGKKLLPKMEGVFKALCYADRTEKKEYSYSEAGEQKVVSYTSTLDLACKLADALPEISFAQKTIYTDANEHKAAGAELDSDALLDQRVQKYRSEFEAKGVKMSYAEALKRVSKEAK